MRPDTGFIPTLGCILWNWPLFALEIFQKPHHSVEDTSVVVAGMAVDLKTMMEALGSCWTEEFGELELEVHHTLTEPTCPMAMVRTESREGVVYFRVDEDTIDAAIFGAVSAAYDTLILRKPKPSTVPWSDRGEDENLKKLLTALDARKVVPE